MSKSGAIILPPDPNDERPRISSSPPATIPDRETWGTAPEAVASQRAMLAAMEARSGAG